MRKRYIIMSFLLLFVAGCASAKVESSGREIKEAPAKVIKVGVTTKEEVIRTYGEPSKTSKTDDSEEIVYDSKKEETPTYLGGLVINEAGKETTVKQLKIVIQNGIVRSYKFEASGD